MTRILCVAAVLLVSTASTADAGTSTPAAAAPGAAGAPLSLPWKLTAGEYAYATYFGTDVNLRWRENDTSGWVGAYSDQVFGTQVRVGADTSVNLAKYVQLQPSLQAASRGFLGGSITMQVGGDWYGLVGFGRTDARPYFNLNFDPNDALTFGAGHHAENGISYLVFVVADDRFHTRQQDWHTNVQIPFGDSHATLDVLRKSGLTDAGPITGWGFSANWDWPRYFVRIAYDPHQNFSSQDAWRFGSGLRF
ncbi:MAG: hypothetical protein QOK23_1245 [Gammaproteobacteria bacterium]|nr:hypothetical protein [Gammaproteobacteria bacterium]MEA3139076.1 hypothetical protein [Gammaproteobacteria bacterium]